MAMYSKQKSSVNRNKIINNLESNFLESFPISLKNENYSPKVIRIIKTESSNENKTFVMNDNEFLINDLVDVSENSSQVIVPSQTLLYYNGVLIGDSVEVDPNQLILSTFEGEPVLINPSEPSNQLIIPVNDSKETIYTCTDSALSNKMVITTEVPTDTEPVILTSGITLKVEDLGANFSESKVAEVPLFESKTPVIKIQNSAVKSVCKDEAEVVKTKTKLSCLYCEKVFEKPFNLQQHERVHTGERPFQCVVCGRAFSQKSNVRKHMTRHRVWPHAKQTLKITRNQKDQDLLNQMSYTCQYCSSSFKSYALYKKHLSVHSNYKVYRCVQKDCNDTFNDLDEFLSHSKMHSTLEFQCHICLKAFTSLEELGAHQYDHDTTGKDRKETEVKLKCNVCHAQFKTVESLKNHMAVDTHKYECIQCKSVFNSERFLRRHLSTHLDSSHSKFSCPSCKKTFRTQKNLNDHAFVHLKEKPFTCEHCDKQFASKYRLKRHMAIHLDQYLECPYKAHLGCDKTFYRTDKLRDHLNTHSRLRSCKDCSKTFNSSVKLSQHMRRVHKTGNRGAVLRCVNCSQTFRKQKQMKQHHCTVGEKKPKSRFRNLSLGDKRMRSEVVSNIEIIMVPFADDSRANTARDLA